MPSLSGWSRRSPIRQNRMSAYRGNSRGRVAGRDTVGQGTRLSSLGQSRRAIAGRLGGPSMESAQLHSRSSDLTWGAAEPLAARCSAHLFGRRAYRPLVARSPVAGGGRAGGSATLLLAGWLETVWAWTRVGGPAIERTSAASGGPARHEGGTGPVRVEGEGRPRGFEPGRGPPVGRGREHPRGLRGGSRRVRALGEAAAAPQATTGSTESSHRSCVGRH